MKISWSTPFIAGKNFAIFVVTLWITAFVLGAAFGIESVLRILLAIVCAYLLLEALARSGHVEVRKSTVNSGVENEKRDTTSSGPTPPREEPVPPPSSDLTMAYELLQVHPSCTDDLLKAAHRHHVAQWHPDKLSNAPEELRAIANDRLASINVAYDSICAHRRAAV